MSIWHLLQRATALYPDAIGVIDGDLRLRYREVTARSAALARFLRARGVEPGGRVSILELNSHPFLEAYFACAGLGAILNPLNTRLSVREVVAILRDAGAAWLLANARFAPLVDEVLQALPLQVLWIGDREPSYEDAVAASRGRLSPAPVTDKSVAQLYYTSGTTGRPKGVMLTHGNVCTHALAAVAELQLSDADVWGHIAPMFHLADAWATFAVTWVGGRHVMMPSFEAEGALETIQRGRVTISNLIPTMLNLMVKHPRVGEYDLASLRTILSGGAPIAPDVVRRVMQVFGCDYVQTYGMTETSPYLTLSALKRELRALPAEQQLRFRARTGRPFLGVELRVVDEGGRLVADDDEQVGEIQVRGPTVTPGYWNLPDATREAFTDDGWLRTGDLAVVDAEGYVNIVDRRKDMIICGGENVYSIEVENVLYEHPAVLEAAVYGVPDEVWGERVCAAVVPREGELLTEADLLELCRRRLARFKVPRVVELCESLPRTGSGKIQKGALKARHKKQEG